jgi:hypothetical protein
MLDQTAGRCEGAHVPSIRSARGPSAARKAHLVSDFSRFTNASGAMLQPGNEAFRILGIDLTHVTERLSVGA